MKRLYLLFFSCLLSMALIGQSDLLNIHNNGDLTNYSNFDKYELFKKLNEQILQSVLFPQNIDLNKKGGNYFGVDEVIYTSKDYRTGAVVNSTKINFYYNSEGKLYQVNYYSWENNTWVNSLKFEYGYNNSRLSIMYDYWYENNAWQKNTKTDYIYNSKDLLTSELVQYQHDYVWTNYRKKDYTYNQWDNIDFFIDYNWIGVTSTWSERTKTKYEYPSAKKGTNFEELASFIYYYSHNGSNWGNNSRVGFIYNDDDKLTQETYDSWSGSSTWDPQSKEDFIYDENGRLSEYSMMYSDGVELKPYTKNELLYGDDDNITSNTSFEMKNDSWVNKSRVINMVYDNSLTSGNVLINDIFDPRTESINMLISWENQDWSNNTWTKTGGANVSYEEVNVLSRNDLEVIMARVYPNPASEYITVDYNDLMTNPSMELYEISGRKLHVEKELNQERIDVSKLQSGMYFYIISDGIKCSKGKLVIK